MTILCTCGAPAGEHVAGGGCERTHCKRFELPGSGHGLAKRSVHDALTRCSECKRRPIKRRTKGKTGWWGNHGMDCGRDGMKANMSENKRRVVPDDAA